MTKRKTFMRTIHPSIFNHLPPQESMFPLNFESTPDYAWGKWDLTQVGMPRYLNSFQVSTILNPNILPVYFFFTTDKSHEKIWDFVEFIWPLEAWRKLSKAYLNLLAMTKDAPPRSGMLSMNSKWLALFISFSYLILVRRAFLHSYSIQHIIVSTMKMYKRGDNKKSW